MTTEYQPGAEEGSAPKPRPVARGLELQVGFLGLDSLYLVLEYPHADVFQKWASAINNDVNDVRLNEGIPHDDMVIRRGGLGYKLSVWDGDARLFITNRVEEKLIGTSAEGQGMGVMLQLGPKWLRQFGEAFAPNIMKGNILGQFILFGIKDPETYQIRINRMDITLDVLGLAIGTFSLDEWMNHWIGYATQKHFHVSSQTGRLEGLSIGTSGGSVRFKAYDKVIESTKRGTSRFWRSVWKLGDEELVPVTRFEWTIKCYAARFANLRHMSDFTFEKFLALLNYVTLKWGSLRIPQGDDTNQTRWPLAPLWVELRRLIDDWSFNFEGYARRDYDFTPDLNDAYLRSLAGWLAGLQVRAGLEDDSDGPASLARGLSVLAKEGYTPLDIQKKAEEKWAVWSRLAGKKKTRDADEAEIVDGKGGNS
jgi:hypothetical protein